MPESGEYRDDTLIQTLSGKQEIGLDWITALLLGKENLGLLATHSFMDDKFTDNELYRDILLNRLHVNEGMPMENIVAQELRASGHKLFFYSRSDTDNRENHKFKGKIGQSYILYRRLMCCWIAGGGHGKYFGVLSDRKKRNTVSAG